MKSIKNIALFLAAFACSQAHADLEKVILKGTEGEAAILVNSSQDDAHLTFGHYTFNVLNNDIRLTKGFIEEFDEESEETSLTINLADVKHITLNKHEQRLIKEEIIETLARYPFIILSDDYKIDHLIRKFKRMKHEDLIKLFLITDVLGIPFYQKALERYVVGHLTTGHVAAGIIQLFKLLPGDTGPQDNILQQYYCLHGETAFDTLLTVIYQQEEKETNDTNNTTNNTKSEKEKQEQNEKINTIKNHIKTIVQNQRVKEDDNSFEFVKTYTQASLEKENFIPWFETIQKNPRLLCAALDGFIQHAQNNPDGIFIPKIFQEIKNGCIELLIDIEHLINLKVLTDETIKQLKIKIQQTKELFEKLSNIKGACLSVLKNNPNHPCVPKVKILLSLINNTIYPKAQKIIEQAKQCDPLGYKLVKGNVEKPQPPEERRKLIIEATEKRLKKKD